MNGHENLIPFAERSAEDVANIRRKGGVASGKARRKKKEMREVLKALLDEKIANKKTGEKATRREVLMNSLLQRAMAGDLRAIELSAKLSGEMPEQRMSMEGNIKVEKPVIMFGDEDEEEQDE